MGMRSVLRLAIATTMVLSGHAMALTTDDLLYEAILQAHTSPKPDLGERLELSSRILGFRHVDIDLPGTGDIPVRLVREFEIGGKYRPVSASYDEFGDWALRLPSIWGVVTSTNKWPASRCAQFGPPPGAFPIPSDAFVEPDQFFHGWHLETHDNTQILLKPTPDSGIIGGAAATTADHWKVTCLSTIENGSGEGFVAHSPQGVRYTFNRLVYRMALPLMVRGGSSVSIATASRVTDERGELVPPALAPTQNTLLLQVAQMLVTTIEDRHGNWVRYNYDAANKLQSIVASDGRRIDFSWVEGRIAIATPNNDSQKAWRYGYEIDNAIPSLKTVTRPDGRSWTFELAGISRLPPTMSPLRLAYAPKMVRVVAPDGLIAEYSLKNQSQPRAAQRWFPTIGPYGYLSLSVFSKTYSGPGVPPLTWNYSQSDTMGWPFNGQAGATEKWVEERAPDGSRRRQTFSIYDDWRENMLLREDVYAEDGVNLLRSAHYSYVQRPCPGAIVTQVRSSNALLNCAPQRLLSREIAQAGDIYLSENLAWDTYNNLTKRQERINSGDTRTLTYLFLNDTSQWALGLLRSKKVNGFFEIDISYNSKLLPSAIFLFGLKREELSYLGNGDLASAKDPVHPAWNFHNYLFGLPRRIVRSDGAAITAEINSDGTIASVTDARGSTTSYQYDSNRRITRVTYPSGDTVAWADNNFTYTYLTNSELGVPIGSLRMRSTQGRRQVSTYHDAFLRPILVEEKDTTTGVTIYKKTAYDHEGRVIFMSYPASTYTATAGVINAYDALGRLTQSRTTDGVTLEQVEYLPGNKKQVTDADGRATTISYQAFGA